MAFVVADRVQETTTTTGTGTVTLAGAVTGFQSFSVVGDGNTTFYTIADQSGSNWEVGIGTYTSSGTTLARTTVLSSSNAGSLVNFGAGTKNVFVTYPASRSAWGLTAGANITLATGNGTTTISAASAGSAIILESKQTITSSYALTSGYNGISVGPVSIASGVAVTVPSNAKWLVVNTSPGALPVASGGGIMNAMIWG
jgi:hypothetical protein